MDRSRWVVWAGDLKIALGQNVPDLVAKGKPYYTGEEYLCLPVTNLVLARV
jgi:hypothetical protein